MSDLQPGKAEEATSLGTPSTLRFQTRGELPPRGDARTTVRLQSMVRAVVLLFLTIAAGWWVYWLLLADRGRPILFTGIVTSYRDSAIPPNHFADRDAALLRDAPWLSPVPVAAMDPWIDSKAKLIAVMEERVARTAARTVVVYLSLHGVSGPNGGYLLTADASGALDQGYPVSRLLHQMAHIRAVNKLLILDVTRLDADFELGLLGNDFAQHLQSAFEALEPASTNLVVLCSSSPGQPAAIVPSLGHTVFGHCVALGLHGAAEANLRSQGGDADRWVSALELCHYVQHRVGSWTLEHRGAAQQPIVLAQGDDFPLVPVRRSIELAEITRRETAAATPAALKAAKPGTADNAALPKQLKPVGELAQALTKAWSEHFEVRQKVPSRPFLWQRYQQQLLEAESELIAGHTEACQELLDRAIPATVARLTKPAIDPLTEPAVDKARTEAQAETKVASPAGVDVVALALEQPTTENLSALQQDRSSVGDLLRKLAAVLVRGNAWTTPAARLAVDVRRVSDRTVESLDPRAALVLERTVTLADRMRREGEILLWLGREAEATRQLDTALREYRRIETTGAELRSRIHRLERHVADLTYTLDWLSAAHLPIAEAIGRRDEVGGFLRSLAVPETWPTKEQLDHLLRLAEALEAGIQGRAVAADALGDGAAMLALLRSMALSPATRQQLVSRLLVSKEVPPGDRSFRQFSAFQPHAAPAVRIPLVELMPWFGSAIPSDQVLALQAANRNDLDSQPSLRQQRAELSARLAESIRNWRSGLEDSQAAPPSWHAWVQSRLAAPARARGLATTDLSYWPDSSPADDAILRRHLNGRLERLTRDQQTLPGDSDPRSLEPLLVAVRRLDSKATAPSQAPSARMTGAELTIREGQGEHTLVIGAPDVTRTSDPGVLVLDWFSELPWIDVAAPSVPSAVRDGELRLPLTTSSIEVVLQVRMSGAPTHEQCRLTARIEYRDGQIEWLPISVKYVAPSAKPAELLVTWQERGGRADRIELFPGQRAGIELAIRKHADVKGLRLQLLAGAEHQVEIPIADDPEFPKTVPVTVSSDLNLPIAAGAVSLRLWAGERLLDEKTVLIDVADPAISLSATAEYEPRESKVRVLVRRRTTFDSVDPIPLSLDLGTVAKPVGMLSANLDPDTAECELLAEVPAAELSSILEAQVAAGGFARAFRFELGPAQPVGVPQSDLAIGIRSPTDSAKFAVDSKKPSLPVELQVDGAGVIDVWLGYDQNADGQLDIGERIEHHRSARGRQIDVLLTNATEKKTFEIRTQARDLLKQLPIGGRQGEQTVLALASSRDATTQTRSTFHLIGEAPELTFERPLAGLPFAVGQPIRALVRGPATTTRLIDSVEFGIDRNNNLKWDEGESIAPLGVEPTTPLPLNAQNAVVVDLPAEGLPARKHTLMARSIVRVRDESAETGVRELRGSLATRSFLISATTPPPGGVIAGTVEFGGQGRKGATVSIDALQRTTVTSDGGKYRFADVPPGAYELSSRLYKRAGKSKVAVESGKTATAKIEIKLDVK